MNRARYVLPAALAAAIGCTSGGTGAGRVQRASGSGFLVDGETISASIDGIGTLTHTVRAEEGVPADLSGAQLPPVSTYRNP